MEDRRGSLVIVGEHTPQLERNKFVAAPKDYFLGPVFAATKQTGSRELTIGDRRYQIGGFNPMMKNLRPPALDVRHARAIFALLSFRDPIAEDETRLIRFSFNELCRRYANSNGGRYSRAIAEIVNDLMNSYIRVTDIQTGKAHTYRLIERVDIEDRPIRRKDAKLAQSPHQTEMWFNGCTLSPEFAGLLNHISELQHLKLDVFTAIRSPLAQAIYLYIPSRAFYHTDEEPFEINLSTLLNQVSFPNPHFKSIRKQIFTQNKNSILSQLDGVDTLTGKFRVRLTETADKTDCKLLAWVEQNQKQKNTVPDENSKLWKAFKKSGRSLADWDQARERIEALTSYEVDLLQVAGVDLGKSEPFFRLTKAILRQPQFDELLAEAKAAAIEGRKVRKNPTARLIHRLMQAIECPVLSAKKR